MTWYYAIAGERRGPIDQQQFDTLVRQGIITMSTLVWRDGMANWQSYSAVAPAILPGQPAIASPARAVTGFATCGNCNQMLPEGDMVLIGDRKYCAACKPLVVQRIKEGVVISSDVEEIRRQYIKHETGLKSAGLLYFLWSMGTLCVGIMMASPLFSSHHLQGRGTGVLIAMVVVCLVLGLLMFFIARGLRRLKRWVRVPVAIFSGIGLLYIPIGTLIHGYILYLVFSKKGQMVFSDEYKAIIAQTPHIKYRSSWVLWLLLVIIIVVLIGAMSAVLTSRR